MLKKKIILLSGVGVLLAGGITFGSYVAYQQLSQETGYKDSYTVEEMNSFLFSKQEKILESLETSLNQQKEIQEKNLSRSGSVSVAIHANSPFGTGKLDFELGNYLTAYQENTLAIGLKDLKVGTEVNMQGQTQSASGSIKNLDLKVFQSGAYLQTNNIFLSEHPFLETIPREYINVLNSLAASGSYLHIPYDTGGIDDLGDQIQSYKDMMLAQQNKQEESLSGAINYIKSNALFEVSRQEDTRYYISPTKAFCALLHASKKEKEAQEQKDISIDDFGILGSYGILGKNIPKEYATIDFSQLTDCDDTTYSSFLNDFSQNFSVYLEKNTIQGHLVIELLENEKFTGYIDIYSGISGIEKSIISITPSQSGSITGSGVYLEIEQKMLSGFIDIKEDSRSLLMHMIPQETTGETAFSGTYTSQETRSIPSYGETNINETQTQEMQNIDISGALKKNGISVDMNTTHSTSGNINPNKNTETSSDIKIEAQFENTENQKKGSISLSGTQEVMGTPIDGNIQLSWSHTTQGSADESQINLSVSSSQGISGSLQIKLKEDVLQNPQEYLVKPTNIIELSDFYKKISFEARKVARMKKIKEAQDIKDFKSGNNLLKPSLMDEEK